MIRIIIVFILSCNILLGQSGRIDHNERVFQLMDRYEVKYGHFEGFTGNSPLFRSEVYDYFFVLDSVGLSPKEEYDRNFILNNAAERLDVEEQESKSRWKHFYSNRSYLYSLNNKKYDFWISANPILYLQSGIENQDNYIIRNTRGIRIKGALGRKVYFSSAIYENQSSFLSYHRQTINRWQAIPGNAFYKAFNFNINNQSYDFLNADGFVGLKVNKFINAELGHGKHFIGHGIRSMLLSDYATNYFYLRTNTRFWKINYQNLFTELAPFTEKLFSADSDLLFKKYMAQHLISFKVNQKIEIGIFETVVFSRENNFELQYLNPIIFYRTVEQFLNSADNVLLGGQVKWNVAPRFQLYGQIVLDDFNLNALREDFNWWGNKFGLQGGFKYIDALSVDHWDLQMEMNVGRPYLYTHNTSFENTNISKANYSHFSQPLAHPLGANFAEYIMHTSYAITNRFIIKPRFIYSIQGIDSPDIYYGSDILVDNGNRVGNANQKLFQGNRTTTMLTAINISYEFFANTFGEINLQYRNSVSPLIDYNGNSLYFGASIRMNFTEEYRDY